MFEIMYNLYLSTYSDVEVTSDTFIVNCTKDLPMKHDKGMRLPVDDNMTCESIDTMFSALPNIVEQIDRQLCLGRKVVVHCQAGQQRSPTVVAAYLIAKCGYDLNEAIEHIKERKRDAFFWKVNFRKSLEKFQAQTDIPLLQRSKADEPS